MTPGHRKIVGLGELLWDLLPAGKQLGGAPSNFAYMSTLLGNEGIVASRIGSDALGTEAVRRLASVGVSAECLQLDSVRATGTVRVEVDAAGQPQFEIENNVAWDFLEWTRDWWALAAQADAICFGSLAQRCDVSRATIRSFVAEAPESAVRVFDVNLRQSFYSEEILAESMAIADIVKLNHEELPRVASLFGLPYSDDVAAADGLLSMHQLTMICVTRGNRGSILIRDHALDEHPGYRVQVADTIGSGDAFTAGLVHEYLCGSSLPEMNDKANRVGAWVASQVGGMPKPCDKGLEYELSRMQR